MRDRSLNPRSKLVKAARTGLRRAGFDVVRYETRHSVVSHALELLDDPASVLLDVGANAGQFVRMMRASGYRGRVVSFEPVTEAYASLCRSSADDPAWEVVHLALGDRAGDLVMHVSANSESSSLLEMLPEHLRAAPESVYVHDERVPVSTLAAVIDRYAADGDLVFAKIDTQGYETKVLDGAGPNMARISGLLVEMSLVPLYQGQDLLEQVVGRLRDDGFTLLWMDPAFWDQETGQLLQVDGVFARR